MTTIHDGGAGWAAAERARFRRYNAEHPDYRADRAARERARRAATAILKGRHAAEYLWLFRTELRKRGIEPED